MLNVPGKMPQFLSMASVFGDDIIIRTVTDNVQQRRWQVGRDISRGTDM